MKKMQIIQLPNQSCMSLTSPKAK